jgi:tRNA (guanosine-2'-O-)-methyltransferase
MATRTTIDADGGNGSEVRASLMNVETTQKLTAYLAQFVTPQRRARIEDVLSWRTRYVTVLVENVYQPHNASAVLRSCEIFGVQDVHVVEAEYDFRPNRGIALGAAQWLTIHQYSDEGHGSGTMAAMEALRKAGYHLAALTLHEDSIPLEALSLAQPVALCLGTEEDGLSEKAHQWADSFVRLPMYGFTQSFNVSVTAALSLASLMPRLRASAHVWRLSEQEQQALRLQWLQQSIRNGALLAEHFLANEGYDAGSRQQSL